jgi:hypothetical protein
LNDCPRPLEPLEIEALAAGSEPPDRSDAVAHVSACPACGQALARARLLGGLLEEAAADSVRVPTDLADRVLRVRPFSRAERWSLAVWRAPLLLLAALGLAGVWLVTGLSGASRDQVGLAAAALASVVGLGRACVRWMIDLSSTAPAGLEALSRVLAPTSVGWAALLLLLPAGFALRRVLSRALARR